MATRAVFGQRVRDVADPTGKACAACAECGRYVFLDEPLRPGDVPMCSQPCGVIAVLRGAATSPAQPRP